MNIKLGGTIDFGDGRTVEISPHSQREYAEVWGNGAFLEILFYEDEQPGEVESDRIHLLITPEGSERRGWLMNIEDANALIQALSVGIRCAIEAGIPPNG